MIVFPEACGASLVDWKQEIATDPKDGESNGQGVVWKIGKTWLDRYFKPEGCRFLVYKEFLVVEIAHKIKNLATTKQILIPKGLTRVPSLNKVVRTMDIQNAKASLGKLCEPDAQFILFDYVKHSVTGWKFYCLVPKTITYHCLHNGFQDFTVITVVNSADLEGICVDQVLTGA